MTVTDELLTLEKLEAILVDRGLRIVVKDGRPVIQGDKKEITPALVAVLKHRRGEILAKFHAQEKEKPVGSTRRIVDAKSGEVVLTFPPSHEAYAFEVASNWAPGVQLAAEQKGKAGWERYRTEPEPAAAGQAEPREEKNGGGA